MHCRHEIINWNNESLEKDLFNPVAGPTGFFHAFFSPSILEGSVSIYFFSRKMISGRLSVVRSLCERPVGDLAVSALLLSDCR